MSVYLYTTRMHDIIVDGIITKGLNLLVAPKEEDLSFVLGLALTVGIL